MARRTIGRRSFFAVVIGGGALAAGALAQVRPAGKPDYRFVTDRDPTDIYYRCDQDALYIPGVRRQRRYSGALIDPSRQPTWVTDRDTGRRADPVNCGRRSPRRPRYPQ